MAEGDVPNSSETLNERVDRIFLQYTTATDGRMRERAFHRVMEHAFRPYQQEENHVTSYNGFRSSLRRTDWDRLFYAMTHQESRRDIGRHGFKILLAQLADNLEAHPYQAFSTIAMIERRPAQQAGDA